MARLGTIEEEDEETVVSQRVKELGLSLANVEQVHNCDDEDEDKQYGMINGRPVTELGLGLANDDDTELELSMANVERVPYCDDAAEGIQDGMIKWGASAELGLGLTNVERETVAELDRSLANVHVECDQDDDPPVMGIERVVAESELWLGLTSV